LVVFSADSIGESLFFVFTSWPNDDPDPGLPTAATMAILPLQEVKPERIYETL
jgi:hypothetical protein